MKADAETLVRSLRERVTQPRVAVLGVLLETDRALSHQEIEARLEGREVDRVTLYRVLDWLVDKGLAHRKVGADRVGRYMAERPGHQRHAHFECDACGQLLCLGSAPLAKVGVPKGFRPQSVELTVHGLCAQCAQPAAR